MNFAGSAIAQGPNVGLIDRLSQWYPTTAEPLWLLLAGATDPPNYINISDRRTRDIPGDRGGTFLSGITRDLANMEDAVVESRFNWFNTVKDRCLTKSTAFEHIRKLFDICQHYSVQPMLYYTGHGEIGTGNWCFHDGTISIQDIVNMLPLGTLYPMIFSDACFSGHWANFCLQKNIAGFECLAACPEYSTAVDTKGKGGDLTLFMTGNEPRPSTEPMYSGGNIRDFPITSGYDSIDYNDFIGSHIFNSENILICQSMYDECFSGCFAPSKRYSPRPAMSWRIRKNYESFLQLVQEQCQGINGEPKQIYSLACDKNLGFGVFFMENYGTEQVIITNLSDIEKKWDDGFMITACAARGSTFYVIMTKDTKEYKNKAQTWFTGTWTEAYNLITVVYKLGRVLTGLCYSCGLGQYFVVMTEIPGAQQISVLFDDRIDWIDENRREGFHPTIIFTDPPSSKTLVVMTADNNTRESYTYRFNYKIKYPQHFDY